MIAALLQVLFQLSQSLLGPLALVYCGHLGTIELDGVSLANSVSRISIRAKFKFSDYLYYRLVPAMFAGKTNENLAHALAIHDISAPHYCDCDVICCDLSVHSLRKLPLLQDGARMILFLGSPTVLPPRGALSGLYLRECK